jgi:hypothetical protein
VGGTIRSPADEHSGSSFNSIVAFQVRRLGDTESIPSLTESNPIHPMIKCDGHRFMLLASIDDPSPESITQLGGTRYLPEIKAYRLLNV